MPARRGAASGAAHKIPSVDEAVGARKLSRRLLIRAHAPQAFRRFLASIGCCARRLYAISSPKGAMLRHDATLMLRIAE